MQEFPLLSTIGAITDWEKFRNKFVFTEGLVDHWRRIDAHHLNLSLSIEGQSVVAWVLVEPDSVVPDLTDTVVRLEGVYNAKFN